MIRAVLALVAFVSLFFSVVAEARADGGLVLRDVPPGGLALAPAGVALTSGFTIVNTAKTPIFARARGLGSDADPRLPAGVTITQESRSPGAALEPGGAVRVAVRWTPGKVDRFDGFVVVEGDGTKQYVAIHGVRDRGSLGAVGRRVLAFLTLLPLLGVLGVLAAKSDRLARRAAIAASTGTLALALVAWWRFVPGLGRADGNDGLQLVERSVLLPGLGVEWYVGVDGASLPLVIGLALVVTSALVLGGSVPLAQRRFFALALVALSGAELALVAVDLTFLALGFAAALLATGVLGVATGAGPAGARAATVSAIAAALLALAVGSIAGRAGPALLVDGTVSPRALALTSAMRASLLEAPRLLGVPFVAAMLLLVVGAALLAMAVFPLSGWLAALVDDTPAPAAMIGLAIGPTLGAYVLVRLGTWALPEAMMWAATGLSIFGALAALAAALGALAETSAPRLVARAAAVQGGLVLVGVSSLTAEGIEGALACAAAGTLVLPLAGYLVATACARAKTNALAELGGLGQGAPLLRTALAIGVASLVGLPGVVGFWGPLLTVTGAIPSQRAAALITTLALALFVVAIARSLARAIASPLPRALATSVALEPFGGHFPDLSREERAGVLPLVVVIVLLGVLPRPLLVLLERAAIDHAAFVDPPGAGQISQGLPRATEEG